MTARLLASYEVTRTSPERSSTTSADPADLKAGRLTRSLRELRPGVLTEITVSPDDPATRRWVLDHLVIQRSPATYNRPLSELLEEIAVNDGVPEPTRTLADSLWESPWPHGTDRALVINGRFVVIESVAGRERPVLVPLDAEGDPEFAELWASFSSIEWASRTSGTWSWSIGLAAEGIVAELEQPDGELDEMRCARLGRSTRPALLVSWLRRRQAELHIDVVMLAVEQVITGKDLRGVRSSYFTDGGSETNECDLWIDTGGQDEEFLRQVRRAGRRDAIDALTKPRSHAAQRRLHRLEEWGPPFASHPHRSGAPGI